MSQRGESLFLPLIVSSSEKVKELVRAQVGHVGCRPLWWRRHRRHLIDEAVAAEREELKSLWFSIFIGNLQAPIDWNMRRRCFISCICSLCGCRRSGRSKRGGVNEVGKRRKMHQMPRGIQFWRGSMVQLAVALKPSLSCSCFLCFGRQWSRFLRGKERKREDKDQNQHISLQARQKGRNAGQLLSLPLHFPTSKTPPFSFLPLLLPAFFFLLSFSTLIIVYVYICTLFFFFSPFFKWVIDRWYISPLPFHQS